MALAHVLDQEVAQQLLRRMLERNRLPSGLLFSGPAGVGKTMMATELAKAVNCRETEAEACDACLSCRKVASGNHPDLMHVAPASKSRVIKVEQIDELVEAASLRPLEGARKVFVLHEADRLNPAAQNKFLKTLEEPPGQSLFILTTEFPRQLLPTVRSRCQNVRFGGLRPETVQRLLQAQRDLPDDLAQAIAALSQGQMTRAIDLIETERRTVMLDIVGRLAKGEDAVVLAEEFSKMLDQRKKQFEAEHGAKFSAEERAALTPEDRERIEEEQKAVAAALHRREIQEYLYLFATWYRDVLVSQSVQEASDALLNRDCASQLTEEPAEGASHKIAQIDAARVLIERNISPDRVFRTLFMDFAAADAA